MIRRFLSDRGGATAIEYAIIATLVSAGLIAAISTIGGSVSSMLDGINAAFG